MPFSIAVRGMVMGQSKVAVDNGVEGKVEASNGKQ